MSGYRALRTMLAVPVAALALSACGKDVIDSGAAEHSVTQVVSQKTGYTPTDVSCPSGVDAKVGGTFDCSFSGPHATSYTAHVRITDINGQDVRFFITAERAR